MKPAEHYRKAEELLAQAEKSTIVSLPDSTPQDQADQVISALEARGLGDLIVVPESVKVDQSGLLAAAQVHATLAVAGSQLRSLGSDGVES